MNNGSGAAGSKTAGKIDWSKLAIRFAVELGPVLLFVVALNVAGLVTATVLFTSGLAVSALVSWFHQRHLPLVPIGLTALALVLGGLTIAQGEARFIQLMPTITNAAAATAILVGLATGHLVLKLALQDGFRLEDRTWRLLSLRMAAYLFAIAAVNEVVRHTVSTESWAWYKASVPLLNALFLAANLRLIRSSLMTWE